MIIRWVHFSRFSSLSLRAGRSHVSMFSPCLRVVPPWLSSPWTMSSKPKCWTCWNRPGGTCIRVLLSADFNTKRLSRRRPEMVVGWYHSHPGFGCWLSSVDVNTQQVRLIKLRNDLRALIDMLLSHSSSFILEQWLSLSTLFNPYEEKSSLMPSDRSTLLRLLPDRNHDKRLATLAT